MPDGLQPAAEKPLPEGLQTLIPPLNHWHTLIATQTVRVVINRQRKRHRVARAERTKPSVWNGGNDVIVAEDADFDLA